MNDNPHTLKVLGDKLFQSGILPYYLHLLDKVQGANHFISQMRKHYKFTKITGSHFWLFEVPKLAREIGGEPNKTLYTA